MEFEGPRSRNMDADPVAVVEALIYINNQLHQHEVITLINFYSYPYCSVCLLFVDYCSCVGCCRNFDLCSTAFRCSIKGVMVLLN